MTKKAKVQATPEKKVFTIPATYDIGSLVDKVNSGDIVPDPDYQRSYVYNPARASKLIESVLMNIPIPTIYLCQEDDESYTVIDGQQRIMSFVKFLQNEFELTGLEEFEQLNKNKFEDLDKVIQRKIKNTPLNTIAIAKESKELKYEIFARLNQGSVKLTPQELRNCIYRGPFNTMLEKVAKNKQLPFLFHDENTRKNYQERILRFFALKNFMDYKSSMLKTMNSFMETHQNDAPKTIKDYEKQFTKTIDIISQILGDNAFCGIDRQTNTITNKFSGSVYDSIIIPFSSYDNSKLMKKADEIRKAINNLKLKNTTYKDDTYAATGSAERVRRRILTVYNVLASIIGDYGSSKECRIFDPKIKDALFHKGYICSYCNNVILKKEDAEIDHITAFSKGGATDFSNAQLLHRHCNREKYNNDSSIEFENEDEE